MSGNNVRRVIRCLTIFATLGLAEPSVAQAPQRLLPNQTVTPVRIQPVPGPPDLQAHLTLDLHAAPTGFGARVAVKVTVSNQYTFAGVPNFGSDLGKVPLHPVTVFGSDASNVIVWISLDLRLTQTGNNMQAPADFQCLAIGDHNVMCGG